MYEYVPYDVNAPYVFSTISNVDTNLFIGKTTEYMTSVFTVTKQLPGEATK